MAEAGDVGGGSRQPPLLLEHLRMHFLKEENNSPFSSGKNLSSSAGSACVPSSDISRESLEVETKKEADAQV